MPEELIERLSGKDALFDLLGVKKDVGGRVRGVTCVHFVSFFLLLCRNVTGSTCACVYRTRAACTRARVCPCACVSV